MAEETKKSRGATSYFKPFGLRQATDLTMLAGAIVIIVGLFLYGYFVTNWVLIVGVGMYIVASGMAIFRSVKTLMDKKIPKTSPDKKRALWNLIFMVVLLGIAIAAITIALLETV